MPFTSYHLASGLLLGLLLRRWVHVPTLLVATTIVIDVEPVLVVLGIAKGEVHGIFHTFVLGIFLGVVTGLVMYLLEKVFAELRILYKSLYLSSEQEELRSYLIGGVVGGFLHILLDAFLYPEMRPLAPFYTVSNPLYISSRDALTILYILYDMILFAGVATYIAYFFYRSRREHGFIVSLFRVGILLILASIIILPTEIRVEDDLHNPLLFSTSISIVLASSGIMISAYSLHRLNLLSLPRILAIILIVSVITYVSYRESAVTAFPVTYIGGLLILLLLRRSLLTLKIVILQRSINLIDLLIISWVAIIALIGVPMIMLLLILLVAKAGYIDQILETKNKLETN